MGRDLVANLFRMMLTDTHTHVEEEVHILGATLLASHRGPQRDRRDAPDEESLCEHARLHGCIWEG